MYVSWVDVFVLCTGRAVRGGQDCLVTVHTHSSSWALLISVLSYSKTSADTGVERCRLSIFCVSQLHTHTHTHKWLLHIYFTNLNTFYVGGGGAVLDLCCVLLGCVMGILLLPTVQSCEKVLCKSANSCEAGKSKGWINASWTFWCFKADYVHVLFQHCIGCRVMF